jgi:NAD(P)-dependent dehydrogenase (short-subunit alcohol dehydrogenase family)
VGELSGKVALVTGGASGIGRATVRRLAEAGAQVVVADLDRAGGEAAAEEAGGRFVAADVSRPEDWAALVAAAEDAFGGLDLAHLNAGVTSGTDEPIALTDEQYRRILGANVDGVVFGVRAVVPAMERRGGGAIVATASVAGLVPFPIDCVYTLTKHAVVGYVRSIAVPLAGRRIRVNAVCPGIVDTPLLGEAKELLERMAYPLIPPADIAAAVVDLLAGDRVGECLVCMPGRDPEPFAFGTVPGLPG